MRPENIEQTALSLETWVSAQLLENPDAGRHFYNVSAIACVRAGHIDEFEKMYLIETSGGGSTMKFI